MMWEIIEKGRTPKDYEYPETRRYKKNFDKEDDKMGMRYPDYDLEDKLDDAYKCGWKEGYKKAMKEFEDSYNERRMGR